MNIDIIFEITKYTDIESTTRLKNVFLFYDIEFIYYRIIINKYCKIIEIDFNINRFNIEELKYICISLNDIYVSNRYDLNSILRYLLIKKEKILFKLLLNKITDIDYISLVYFCISKNYVKKLNLIERYYKKKYNIPFIIRKELIGSLMIGKLYSMVKSIINIYLGDTINWNLYFNEIYNNFNYKNRECLRLLEYLSESNIFKIKNKMLLCV